MLDIRDTDVARRNAVMARLPRRYRLISNRPPRRHRQRALSSTPTSPPPAPRTSSKRLPKASASPKASITYKKMVSRAYHDSNFMAAVAPIAMIFIPCRGGVSHRPDEYSTPHSIALGTRLLALTLAQARQRITRRIFQRHSCCHPSQRSGGIRSSARHSHIMRHALDSERAVAISCSLYICSLFPAFMPIAIHQPGHRHSPSAASTPSRPRPSKPASQLAAAAAITYPQEPT